jgi:hypothetical protein
MEKSVEDNTHINQLKKNLNPSGEDLINSSNLDSNIPKVSEQDIINIENEINTFTRELTENNTYRSNTFINPATNYNTSTFQSSSTVRSTERHSDSGFDFDRIVGYTLDLKELFTRLTCSICTLIPFDPLECKNCNAIVCKQCKDRWDKKECVFRCGGEGDETPSRILRDVINSLCIKCTNNIHGCQENFKPEKLKSHEIECSYEEIKCPFSDCKYFDIRKNVLTHIDKCEHNKIKCKFCKNTFKKSEFDKHIEEDCEEVLIECTKCQKNERRKNFIDGSHNCINMLKEEIKELSKNLSSQIDNYETIKISYDDLRRQNEEEKRLNFERNYLITIYINMLKSINSIVYEDEMHKMKPHNVYNPMQCPYIFRFMTSSRTVQITNFAESSYFKINLNINFEIPTSHQSIVTSNKRIFIVGGVNHEKKTYEFDILNKSLIEKADLKIGRRRHILTELRCGVFIASGGCNQSDEVLRDCEAYITGKDKWVKISSMNFPRFYHTAFAFNYGSSSSYLYAVGGCDTGTSCLINLNSIERIELDQDLKGTWEVLEIKHSGLFKAKSRLSYIFIETNKIILFGGIPDHQAVLFDFKSLEMSDANQYNIEGRFFFNDRCTWHDETLFISSQSSRCIFSHLTNTWITRDFNEEATI